MLLFQGNMGIIGCRNEMSLNYTYAILSSILYRMHTEHTRCQIATKKLYHPNATMNWKRIWNRKKKWWKWKKKRNVRDSFSRLRLSRWWRRLNLPSKSIFGNYVKLRIERKLSSWYILDTSICMADPIIYIQNAFGTMKIEPMVFRLHVARIAPVKLRYVKMKIDLLFARCADSYLVDF